MKSLCHSVFLRKECLYGASVFYFKQYIPENEHLHCSVQLHNLTSWSSAVLSQWKNSWLLSCTHNKQRNPSPEQSQPNVWRVMTKGRDSPLTCSNLHLKTGSLGKRVELHYVFSPLKAYLAVLPHSADPCLVPTFIKHLIGIYFS